MQQYVYAIRMAFLFFPFLAALFSLPFLLVQYHRYGAIPMIRTAVVYSFMLYLLCSYFLVILPLPDVAQVAKRTDASVNLIPYKIQLSYWKGLGFDFFSLQAWKAFYRSKVWQEPVLNVLMTIPFGVYLRYYFRRRWWQTLLAGLALSLFFELTQLSALYGIYPRPYRMFDTTDLINNTTGTLIGFWLTPLLVFFLPTKQALEEIAYKRGEKISVFRRCMAFLVDWAVIGIVLVASLWGGATTLFWLCGTVYFAVVPVLSGGYTIGSYLCSFRIVQNNGKKAGFWRCAVRSIVLYFPFATMTFLWLLEMKLKSRVPTSVLKLVVGAGNVMEFVSLLCAIVLLMQSIRRLFQKEKRYYHEVISGTRLISTIQPRDSDKKETVPAPTAEDWIANVKIDE